jgi:hypothetical protein
MKCRLSLTLHSAVIVVILATPGIALPDIVNVTVNGSLSGSGNIAVACGLATPGCEPDGFPDIFLLTVPFSFSDINSTLGPFNASGTANLPSPFSGSVTGFGYESTTATAQALAITLGGGYSSSGIFYSLSTSGNDTISVGFDLTEESLMQLTEWDDLLVPAAGELLDSQGNVLLEIPPAGGSASLVLEPGEYQLNASAAGYASYYFLDQLYPSFALGLNADFTPVPTPEPRWTILAALLSIVLGRWVVYRLYRAS